MVSVVKFAQTIQQSNGERFGKQYDASFDNIDNLKKQDSVATCTLEASTGTYAYIPTLNFTNFGFDIPATAKINKVILTYEVKISGCTIQAPIVSLPTINHAVGYGVTPSSSYQKDTVTFETTEMQLSQISPDVINDSGFGVEIYHNVNQGSAGTYQIRNVRVEVQYSESSYSISSNIPTDVLYEGQTIDLEVSCTQKVGYSESEIQVLVEVPYGCEIIPNNSIQLIDNQYVWNVAFAFLENTKTATCSIRLKEAGEYAVKFTEKVHNTSKSFTFNVESLKTLVQVLCDESIKIGETIEITIQNTYLETPYWDRECTIELPLDFSIVEFIADDGSVSISTSSTENTVSWIIPAMTETAELVLHVMPTIATISKILCYENNGSLVNSKEILVLPADYTIPFYAKYIVTDDTRDLMGSSIVYNAISYIRLDPTKENVDEVYEFYEDFRVNHRFGVFHDSGVAEDNDVEMINSCQFSDFLPLDDGWYKAEISFNYDGESPIVMYWTGDYLERDTSLVNVWFSTPFLIEAPYYSRLLFKIPEYGNWPKPLKNLLTEGEYGSVKLAKRESAGLFRTYNLDMGGVELNENFAFQGFTIYFDYETDNPCGVSCSVFYNDLEGQRNTVVEKGSGTAKIGSTFDLFGLKYTDIENSHMEFEFKIFNSYANTVNIKIKNIRVDVTWSILDSSQWGEFWINGESSRYYECFLKDLTIVGGVETDVEIFHAEGNDIHIPYRQAISVKEIDMEFYIESCEFANATQLFLRASRWFMNERDKYNRPMLNTIEFEHIPDMKYEYLLEDGLDEEVLEGGNYKVKATLTVPAGTMESKTPVVTGESGVNNGIARVTPTLEVSAIWGDIAITETISGQLFKLEYNGISIDDILVIDCENRKVTLQKANTGQEVDISSSVDFDSDWFVLFSKEEYNFECDNANFLSCTFYERW